MGTPAPPVLGHDLVAMNALAADGAAKHPHLAHFSKSVTQCCPPSDKIVQAACHWLTYSFKILACLLLADTVVSCQPAPLQPRPVRWKCSVATRTIQL